MCFSDISDISDIPPTFLVPFSSSSFFSFLFFFFFFFFFFFNNTQHDAFFSLYNTFTFLGGSISRKVAYLDKVDRPIGLFLLFSVAGVALNVVGSQTGLGVLALFGGMCVFLGNGSIYNRSTKNIDNNVASVFNLTALSTWLLIGDLGSVAGSNLTPYLSQWLGNH